MERFFLLISLSDRLATKLALFARFQAYTILFFHFLTFDVNFPASPDECIKIYQNIVIFFFFGSCGKQYQVCFIGRKSRRNFFL